MTKPSQPAGTAPDCTGGGKAWAIILAAGSGKRLAAVTQGRAKQFLTWQHKPLYFHACRVFCRSAAVAGLVVVFPPDVLAEARQQLQELWSAEDPGLPYVVVAGGEERQDSVRLALAALPATVQKVLVHDAARPFVSAALVHRVADALQEGAEAVIPAVPLTDTIKQVHAGKVKATLPREDLAAVQTPQGFAVAALRQAHEEAQSKGLQVTDDAALMEAMGQEVLVVAGEHGNVKITRPEDLSLLQAAGGPVCVPCCGMGYDVHRYVENGRPLKLGGVLIPKAPAVQAHSDGDVLLHALMDALLGSAALGDIGRHFPDSDAQFDNISSAILLDAVLELLAEAQVTVSHVDVTIVAQQPRLAAFRDAIRNNVARLLALDKAQVNIKATTEEHLGFTGRVEGIKAYAMVSAYRMSSSAGPCSTSALAGAAAHKD